MELFDMRSSLFRVDLSYFLTEVAKIHVEDTPTRGR